MTKEYCRELSANASTYSYLLYLRGQTVGMYVLLHLLCIGIGVVPKTMILHQIENYARIGDLIIIEDSPFLSCLRTTQYFVPVVLMYSVQTLSNSLETLSDVFLND